MLGLKLVQVSKNGPSYILYVFFKAVFSWMTKTYKRGLIKLLLQVYVSIYSDKDKHKFYCSSV